MINHFTIAGGGLVGSLLAVLLAKKGKQVTIYERRADMRTQEVEAGRSINLALSHRGRKALQAAGLEQAIMDIAIPMYGRVIHQIDGATMYQPYSNDQEAIYSVSRSEINKQLLSLAEAQSGVTIHFNSTIKNVNLKDKKIEVSNENTTKSVDYEMLLGGDGSYSPVRAAMMKGERFNYSQHYEQHGYKELNIPPDAAGNTQLQREALHIWPRDSFMLIALPNLSGDFTCTLFLQLKGNVSFEALDSNEKIIAFMQKYFADALALMPNVLEDFNNNPTASLVTVRCYPWAYGNSATLLGDAAHAIIPFYGQGMNCGFEDARVLSDMLDSYSENDLLDAFQQARKPNADAIADMACDNFIEMRDLSGKADFQAKKGIEKQLSEAFSGLFVSQYAQVTFSHTPYSTAQRNGKIQAQLLDDLYHKKLVIGVDNDAILNILNSLEKPVL
jgi:kynurenine 3-monooxygenase